MKTLIIGLFVAVAGHLTVLEESTLKLSNNSIVTFNKDQSGKMAGAFLVKNSSSTLKMRGVYKDGNRVGDWYCFDNSGKVVLRYNYDLKKMVVLEQSQIDGLSSEIKDKAASLENAKVPVPIFPVDELKSLLSSELELQMPAKLKGSINNVQAKITVYITAEGKAKYQAKYVLDGYEYTTVVNPNRKNFDIEWIPATSNSKPYKSEASFNVSFKLDPSDNRRFLWTY